MHRKRSVLETASIAVCLFVVSLTATAADRVSSEATKQPGPLTLDTIVATVPLRAGEAPLQVTLKQAMDAFKIPGFSVAVVDAYAITWAEGFGATAPGGREPVTPKTLYQAASISKPVAAAGALWLVEHDKLDLDENVNRKLTSWKVPENAFTATQKVTLRRLMSHNAGVTVHGFAGYRRDTVLPTLKQILDGEPPANSPPIRVDSVPGTQVVYSGGGVTIERQWMMDISHRPFADFMQDTVLDKAGMVDSTFAQPLPAALVSRAATGTRIDGTAVEGGWHVYPEGAADGLWTTPTDLARFAIEIALSKHGRANHILSQAMTKQMLSRQAKGEAGAYGLGFAVGDTPGSDLFSHNGANEGFQAQLFMLADSGRGIAIMGNSDAFEPLISHVFNTIADASGWKLPSDKNDSFGSLLLVYELRGLPEMLDAYQSMKTSGFAGWEHGPGTLNNLGYRALSADKVNDAVRIFALNVAEYPEDANAYDSLGEAYGRVGKKELAIKNYRRSLDLNPRNTNAEAQLKKLRGP